MYCVKLTLQPTAAMTFRIMPGSILNIATYPFVPPTSLSGFLRRLSMMSAGLGIPETKVNKENPSTYLLPYRYVALGAYSSTDKSKVSGVHRTYRKGMREFNHDDFSKLYSDGDRANFQLHTWEYWIAEELVGYVATESANDLAHIQDLESYGCYIGKEGYAVVSAVSEVIELKRRTMTAYPSTIASMDTLLQSNQLVGGCDIYNLYRYNWLTEAQDQTDQQGLLDEHPTPVDGFIPFVAAHFPKALGNPPTLDYYTDSEEIFIPVSLFHLLKGEIYAESL
jgi:hypothetical protein